ncbi:MAG: serine acetyltransferase [Pseudomonadota bacterium]
MSETASSLAERKAFLKAWFRQNPPFFKAVAADARFFALYRQPPVRLDTRLGLIAGVFYLIWTADAFLPLLLHRLKMSLKAKGVPVLPVILHRLSIMLGQVHIGFPALLEPGVFIAHGQIVVDGFTQVKSGVVIRPFVTIGLKEGDWTGPTIEENVSIGTGAKVLGPITVGADCKIGANAVVLNDLAPGTTAVGAPARAVKGDP